MLLHSVEFGILLGLIFASRWVVGSETHIATECAIVCASTADEVKILRAENAILRFRAYGSSTVQSNYFDPSLVKSERTNEPNERTQIQPWYSHGSGDRNWNTDISSVPIRPPPHLKEHNEGVHRKMATLSRTAASFTQLVAAVASQTVVGITANISFESAINISGVSGLVIMGTRRVVLDGQFKTGLFLVSNSTVEFYNITFTNGYVGARYATEHGSAIYASLASSLTILTCSFESNTAAGYGGAIYISSSTITTDSCSFLSNSAVYGGAMYIVSSSTTSIKSSSFNKNSAGWDGGAVYISSSTTSIESSSFEANSAGGSRGGAVFIIASFTASIESSSFKTNSAGWTGGAVFFWTSTASIESSSFEANYAHAGGGAVKMYLSVISIESSSFEASSIDWSGGGALSVYFSTASIKSSSFKDNYADADGGGAIIIDRSTASIESSSFKANTALNQGATGGALKANQGTLIINSSTFKSNYAPKDQGNDIANVGSAVSWIDSFINYTTGENTNQSVYDESSLSCSSACYAGKYGECENFGNCWSCKPNICLKCPVGKYSIDGASSDSGCTECPMGRASNTSGSVSCETCSAGRYSSDSNTNQGMGVIIGATRCLVCPEGAVSSTNESYYCTACEAGKYSYEGSLKCTACVAGKYTPSSGFGECARCERGKKANTNISATECEKCMAPYSSFPQSTSCSVCVAEYYRKDTSCLACPENGECPFGTTINGIIVNSGSWRTSGLSKKLELCPFGGAACKGGNYSTYGVCEHADDHKGPMWCASSYCKPGYTGPLCAVCEADHYLSRNICDSCEGNLNPLIVVYILAGIVALLAIAIFGMRKKNALQYLGMRMSMTRPSVLMERFNSVEAGISERVDSTFERLFDIDDFNEISTSIRHKLKILVAYYQLIASIGVNLNGFAFGDIFDAFALKLSAFISLDPGLIPFTCRYPEYDFGNQILVVTMFPIILILLIGFVVFVCYTLDRRRGIPSEKASLNVREKGTSIILVLLYLVFPTCSSQAFWAFSCHALDLEDTESPVTDYMTADYRISCGSGYYLNFIRIYAISMVLLYPIGVPALFAVLLWKHRSALYPKAVHGKTEDEVRDLPECVEALSYRPMNIMFLYRDYEPRCYWYEVLECYRRLLLSSFLIIICSVWGINEADTTHHLMPWTMTSLLNAHNGSF
uniref:Uncharacterized protein n=1 Tax=Octactis speculum TaxID=3111310 RepID=A0A7S2C0Q9_9STRA|mmetsp:Transcript_30192/g.40933  ORF Transcript_30192/g.40933 Transcript_30192/m.40933 type:complete len:1178 (+) Transcript_30192:54-3587(+)